MISKYPIGYTTCVFYNGVKTTYRYAGNGDWEFISGENCSARYAQLLDMLGL